MCHAKLLSQARTIIDCKSVHCVKRTAISKVNRRTSDHEPYKLSIKTNYGTHAQDTVCFEESGGKNSKQSFFHLHLPSGELWYYVFVH